MPTYLHPGVYIEEIPSGARPIEAVSTSIPIFVGAAQAGPVNRAEFILKWDDYKELYGGVLNESDTMGLAVSSFYSNGGGAAYVARLAFGAAASSLADGSLTPKFDDANNPLQGKNALSVAAKEVGTAGDGIKVSITNATDETFTLTVTEGDITETYDDVSMNERSARFVVSRVNETSQLVELGYLPTYGNVDSAVADGAFPLGSIESSAAVDFTNNAVLNAGGMLNVNVDGDGVVAVQIPAKAAGDYTGTEIVALIAAAVPADVLTVAFAADKLKLTSPTKRSWSSVTVLKNEIADELKLTDGTSARGIDNVTPANMATKSLSGGSDGSAPGASDYQDFFGNELVKMKDVSIIVLPGKPLTDANRPVVDAALAHCEATKSRMTIVDPPSSTELKTSTDVAALGLPTKTYAALYYPWLKVANPFYDPEREPTRAKALTIAPSAAAAGMWGKIDGKRGVWKAPAGINTGLLGIAGAQYEVEDGIQDQLNPLGVNCVRKFPRFSFVFWGARTLATNTAPEWRYVPIRRTAIMIERSIYEGIQWAVFEPNDHNLWASIRLNVETFMDGLFRAGAFQGETASDAYFVRCGLGDTMTQGDIDAGRAIAIVGFAPLKPAEFVIIRIQQKVQQQ